MSYSRDEYDHQNIIDAFDEVVVSQTQSPNHFSSLLWMPYQQHQISFIPDNPNAGLRARHHRPKIPCHERCGPILKRMGLYQVARMKDINADPSLLAGLMERWRLETHTFHLLVGEMTVILQDVSCLWGLPIRGEPVTGLADGPWNALVDQCLGVGAATDLMKSKKRSKPGEDPVYSASGYAINLGRLRRRFRIMSDGPDEPTQHQVYQYTRAYILDLFGSLLFTDSSGDLVPAMYLQFLRDLDTPVQYNWGGVVLALLYKNLYRVVTRTARMPTTIWGPMVLLQHWAWSRLPCERPHTLNNWEPTWGSPDRESCPAFGEKWCCRHEFKDPHGTAGVKYFRTQLQDLREGTKYLKSDHRPVSPVRDEAGKIGYIASGTKDTRNVLEAMKVSYVGVRLAITKGFRRVGKKLIGSCIGIVRNTGMEPRLQAHLTEHGLPTNYEDIPSDESTDISDAAVTDMPAPYASTEHVEPSYVHEVPEEQGGWVPCVSTEHVGPSYVHEVPTVNTNFDSTLPPQQYYQMGVHDDSFLAQILITTPPHQILVATPPHEMTPPQQILVTTPPREMTPPQQILVATPPRQTTPPQLPTDEIMPDREIVVDRESDRRRSLDVVYERRHRRRRAPNRFTPNDFL